jgi:hypothetical protein
MRSAAAQRNTCRQRMGASFVGCFRPDANPDAPVIILPGFGDKIERTARLLAEQDTAVPIFIKRGPKQWRYVGEWRLKHLSTDPVEIAKQEKRANRKGTISMVLFLERAP